LHFAIGLLSLFAYYANRYFFDKDENENDSGKNYIKFEAMLKVIKKLIREAK